MKGDVLELIVTPQIHYHTLFSHVMGDISHVLVTHVFPSVRLGGLALISAAPNHPDF